MDYYLKASEFAEKYVAPVAKKIDETKEFPKDIFEKLYAEGFLKLIIPESEGGLGGDIYDHAEVVRALAKESATVGLCYMMHNVGLNVVLNAGKDELKKKIIDEVINEGKIFGLAYSESGSGVYFHLPDTTAKRDGEGWVINGSKSMVTSAEYASYYILNAKTGEGRADTDHFCIPVDAKGLTFRMDRWNGIGLKGNVSCPMYMEDMRIDEMNRIGEIGAGLEQMFAFAAPLFIQGLAAVYSGLNEAIAREAIMHAMDRKFPDGSTLANVDTIKLHISKIYNYANAGVSACRAAALAARNGDEDALAKILSARVIAIENVVDAGRLGMLIGGGRAYSQYRNFARYLVDGLAGQVMAPSVDVLHQWIGSVLTDQMIP